MTTDTNTTAADLATLRALEGREIRIEGILYRVMHARMQRRTSGGGTGRVAQIVCRNEVTGESRRFGARRALAGEVLA